MCGVVAKIGTTGIEPAMARLAHRGVRSRVAEVAGCQLGHVRLPIVGIGEEYDQPVERGRWTIAFVGEVLNFRDYLLAACDLPLVEETWGSVGVRGFSRFDGFWTVVAVDNVYGSIHVLVDYLAQKPAYYRSDEHAVAVASEPDAVACLGPVTPDEVYFSAVVKWGYCPERRRTPYREVKKTLPGEHVVLGKVPGGLRREVVDTLMPNYVGASVPDNLKYEIECAVRRRVLSSDVPVACLLSGGLDSSIVYTLARRWGDVRAYYAEDGAGPGDLSERLRVSAVLGNDRADVIAWDAVLMARGLKAMQEPVDLGSVLPQMALSDGIAALGGERVCLTGDGADEFFGGYGRALRYDSQASDVWHELVNYHLPRLDRVMMRNRIEVRSPFLARRVAEIALALPRKQRVDKKILRDLFRKDLPPGIADAPKVPLRTREIEGDREARSLALVNEFRRKTWPEMN